MAPSIFLMLMDPVLSMFRLQELEQVVSTLSRTIIPAVYAVSARALEKEHAYAVVPLVERQ